MIASFPRGIAPSPGWLIVDWKPWEVPGLNLKMAPYVEGTERPKTEADYSRLVGGSFNKQGDFSVRVDLASVKAINLGSHLLES